MHENKQTKKNKLIKISKNRRPKIETCGIPLSVFFHSLYAKAFWLFGFS